MLTKSNEVLAEDILHFKLERLVPARVRYNGYKDFTKCTILQHIAGMVLGQERWGVARGVFSSASHDYKVSPGSEQAKFRKAVAKTKTEDGSRVVQTRKSMG